MKFRILALIVIFSGYCFGQEYSQSWKNLNYAGDNNDYHALDIYLPKTVAQKYPVVVYVYGSAWLSNHSKGADLNTIGKALLDAGFAVVMPNHRSSIDAIFPAPINDIKAPFGIYVPMHLFTSSTLLLSVCPAVLRVAIWPP